MSYVSPYGQSDGIERRLIAWRNQLACDKSFPWVGTGLIDDIECAARLLGGEVPARPSPVPPPEEDEFAEFRAHMAAGREPQKVYDL